ncbi:MAG: LytR/AlgR family response regulator transcription factor [Bacteroidales bacterium]
MLKTIIIEHEASVRENLRNIIDRHCPNVMVIAGAGDLDSGEQIIQKLKPDLVFLSIDKGLNKALEMLEKFSPLEFKVIFLADWEKSNIRPFRFCCLDYLDRPPDPQELKAAVAISKKIPQQDFNLQLEILKDHLPGGHQSQGKIIIPSSGSLLPVSISDIEYLRSEGNFTYLHLRGGQSILASNTLMEFKNMLGEFGFIMQQHSLVKGRQL